LFLKFIVIAKKGSKSDSKGKVVCVTNNPIVSDVSLDDHVFHVYGRQSPSSVKAMSTMMK
jgi:hypothetical protein